MSTPTTNPRSTKLARKKLTMAIVCGALILGAIFLLVMPVKLPLPLRLGLAFTDLVAAAAVWLMGSQQFSGR